MTNKNGRILHVPLGAFNEQATHQNRYFFRFGEAIKSSVRIYKEVSKLWAAPMCLNTNPSRVPCSQTTTELFLAWFVEQGRLERSVTLTSALLLVETLRTVRGNADILKSEASDYSWQLAARFNSSSFNRKTYCLCGRDAVGRSSASRARFLPCTATKPIGSHSTAKSCWKSVENRIKTESRKILNVFISSFVVVFCC